MPNTGGETTVPVGDWTTGTLKIYHDEKIDVLEKYIEQRFTDQDKAVQAALQAAKEAVEKAEEASNKRFDSVNEFRGQLNDQVNTFLPRLEYNARHETLENRVTELTDRINRSEGITKGGDVQMSKIYAAIATVGAILGIIVLVANGVFH